MRAALLFDDTTARYARMQTMPNVAVFGARTWNPGRGTASRLFLSEPFEGGRHSGRIAKIRGIVANLKEAPGAGATGQGEGRCRI